MSEGMHPRGREWIKRIAALAIGLGVAFALLAAVEYGFYRYNQSEADRVRITYDPPGDPNEFRLILGYRPRGPREYTAKKTINGESVYSVHYTIDEHHRRATSNNEGAQSYLAIFGGSFAFGEGVNDDETLAARLANHTINRNVYNFGYSGYGPQHTLVQIENDEAWAGVTETRGDAIYILIPHHFMRAAGSMRVVTAWGRHFPAYRLEEGSLIHLDTFHHAQPWRNGFYGIVAREQILRAYNVDWPMHPRTDDIELTAALLAAARDALQDRGGENFAIVLYPSELWRPADVDATRDALLGHGIAIADFSGDYELASMTIPGDGHPNADAFAYLSEQLTAFFPWLQSE